MKTRRSTQAAWGLVLAVAVAAGACGDPKPEAPSGAAESGLTTVRWAPVDGATQYRVRGWSGSMLLFEVNTSADSLPWTPSLVRAASAFDTVVVRVQGLDARWERQGELEEIRVLPAPRSTPGR